MITARGLTKRYGRTIAVRDLTFTVLLDESDTEYTGGDRMTTGHPLSAWAGFAVMCLDAAAALAAGGLALVRRDA